MSDHHCPGLFRCNKHPRWHVYKTELRGWCISPPFRTDGNAPEAFPTHAEAINHAQQAAAYQYWANNRTAGDEWTLELVRDM